MMPILCRWKESIQIIVTQSEKLLILQPYTNLLNVFRISMKRITFPLLLIFSLLCVAQTYAQGVQRCATDELMEAQYNANPTLRDQVQQLRRDAQNWSATHQGQRMVITIPVHVIVVHLPSESVGTGRNLSMTQIQSQIDVLNEDYRRLNTDASNTPAAFQGVAADCEIEFCLASVDPNGNPTDGVTRYAHNSSTVSSSTLDNSIKPATTWNRNAYLNIWTARITGGILGYAYFPPVSDPDIDGVVVLDQSFGRPSSGAPYNLGRTAVHEVGHYLGLSHVWGDGGGCGDDDGINDTPTSSAPYYGCPSFPQNSCSSNDMHMNYMDYVDDACMNLFTAGQKSVMVGVLNTHRSGLLNSAATNCSTTGGGLDANFSASPTSGCAPLSVNFSDLSSGSPVAWQWTFQGGTPAISTSQNPSVVYSTPGTYTVVLTVTDNTGATDTETQTTYITVNNCPAGGCDTLSTIPAGSTPTLYVDQNGGFVSGHNSYQDAAKAESFTYTGTGNQLDAALVGFGYAVDGTGSSMATVRVWDGTGGTPGASLGSATISYASIVTDVTNGDLTNVTFSPAITLPASNQFFIGVELAYGSGDTLALITNTDGDSPAATGWELFSDNTTWVPYDDANSWGLAAGHYIFPVVCSGSTTTGPTAAFSSDVTSGCAPFTVNFMDASTGTPTSWVWTFPGGTPTSSTMQNPTVSYATPGTYNVTLTVTNSDGSDTQVQTGYITANNCPVGGGCDTLLNVPAAATPTLYIDQNGGFVSGHNSYQDAAKAEYFNYAGAGTQLADVLYGFGYAVDGTGSSMATLSIWDGTGGTPGAVLGTATVAIATIATDVANGDFTQVTFSPAITLPASGEFFAGVNLSYGSGDTLALITTTDGDTPAATGWELFSDNTTWVPYDDANSWGLAAAHYVLPIVCSSGGGQAPVASFTSDVSMGCAPLTVNFSDASTNSPTVWNWAFPGGTPSSSSAQNPTVVYNTPGTYSVTLTASNGAGTDTEVMATAITVSAPPAVSVTTTAASCGASDGSATATGADTYMWSDGQTTATATGLAAGTYTVTGTNAAGCSSTVNVTINSAGGASLATTTTDPLCEGGSDGTAMVTATGGTTPYTYSWSNGGTMAMASGLAAGSYTVTVTDAAGCVSLETVTINDGASPTVTVTGTDVNCNGASEGSAAATAADGTPPYTYDWSDGQTGANASNLAAGTYTVTVTDANGCTASESVTINEPANALSVTATSTDATTQGANDGTATAMGAGGTPPYSYQWNTGGTTETITGLSPATYTVTVTDANGCTTSETVMVNDGPASLDDIFAAGLTVLETYPNPSAGVFTIKMELLNTDNVDIAIFDIQGRAIYETSKHNVVEMTQQIDVSGSAAGIYMLRVMTSKGITYKRLVVEQN